MKAMHRGRVSRRRASNMHIKLRHARFELAAQEFEHKHLMRECLYPHRRGGSADREVARSQEAFASQLALIARSARLEMDQQPFVAMRHRLTRHDRGFRPGFHDREAPQFPAAKLAPEFAIAAVDHQLRGLSRSDPVPIGEPFPARCVARGEMLDHPILFRSDDVLEVRPSEPSPSQTVRTRIASISVIGRSKGGAGKYGSMSQAAARKELGGWP